MNKKNPSESDICDRFSRPAMVAAGWNGQEQLYREFPLRSGRVLVRCQKSQRGKSIVSRGPRNCPKTLLPELQNIHHR